MGSILLTLVSLVAPTVVGVPAARPSGAAGSAAAAIAEDPALLRVAEHVYARVVEAEVDAAGAAVPAAAVELALTALEDQVKVRSHRDALRSAFTAYFAYRSAHPERVRKPYLYYVDYGLDHRTPRGYVFDMDALGIVEGPFTVAEGRGSLRGADGVPTRFSNVRNSLASSLGLYLTQETYGFRGTAGGRRYQSVGLRLQGLSGEFNDAARARGVVVHGAPYVTPVSAGRSEGCPAMEEARAQRLLPRISNGSLVFLFSPRDASWMRSDPWASRGAGSGPLLAR
jgi:hypothetical protein